MQDVAYILYYKMLGWKHGDSARMANGHGNGKGIKILFLKLYFYFLIGILLQIFSVFIGPQKHDDLQFIIRKKRLDLSFFSVFPA